MSIEFNCPHCDKVLRTTDDKAGRQAKCPGCGNLISIPGLADDLDQFDASLDEDHEELPPAPPKTSGRKPSKKSCPACGAEIASDAIHCQFCGEVFKSDSLLIEGRPSGFREIRPFPPGEVVSEAWRIFTQRMGSLVGSFVVVSFLEAIVQSTVYVPAIIGEVLRDQGNEIGGLLFSILGILLYFVTIVFTIYLQTGYMILNLKAAREQPFELADLFSGGPFLGRMILTSMLFGLMMVLGICAFLIPGIFLGIMYWPYGYLLVDKNYPGIQSLTRAKAVTDGNWGSLFIVFIVCGASAFAGMLVCYVGLLLALPFVQLLLAVAYDRMSCQTPLHPQAEN